MSDRIIIYTQQKHALLEWHFRDVRQYVVEQRSKKFSHASLGLMSCCLAFNNAEEANNAEQLFKGGFHFISY